MIVIAMASVSLVAAQEKAAVDEAKPLVDAMAAIGSIIAGAGTTPAANSAVAGKDGAATAESATAPAATETSGEPTAAKNPRSMKNSVILVTSGAAAGAAIGAAMGKGSKGAMIGAATFVSIMTVLPITTDRAQSIWHAANQAPAAAAA